MKTYDREKAARVMQRVRESTPPAPDTQPDIRGLKGLIADELAASAAYLHLSRHFTGEESAMLKKMAQQEQSHAACLKGIYALLTGQQFPTGPNPQIQGVRESILRRCYLQELRSITEYESRQSDGEYGCVFSQLAQDERQHSRQVLFLLGNLK